MGKRIIINLSTSDTQVSTEGFNGDSCMKEMRDLSEIVKGVGLDLNLEQMIKTEFSTVNEKTTIKE